MSFLGVADHVLLLLLFGVRRGHVVAAVVPVHHLVLVRGVGGEVFGEVLQQDILDDGAVVDVLAMLVEAVLEGVAAEAVKRLLLGGEGGG